MIGRIVVNLKTFALCLACLLISCESRPVKNGMLILSETPGNIKSDLLSGPSGRYFPGARISVIRPGKPDSHFILTEDFYSACQPAISFDGARMLFTAQKREEDTWQIWEMELDNIRSRKITSFSENCSDPAYLPDGRLVFSKLTINDTVKSAHCLFSCNPDGSDLRQITFSPVNYLSTIVLKDGRLLTFSWPLLNDRGEPMLTVMRPDGTKADKFCGGTGGSSLIGSLHETPDGKIVFTESTGGDPSVADLISVNYNRPLHTRINLTSQIKEEIAAVLPLSLNKFLISCRGSDSGKLELREFDPENKTIGQVIWSDPDYNILEAFIVRSTGRPKKLPSEVDLEVKTGLLLCQDINFLNQELTGKFSIAGKASRIEVLGVDTTYGIVQVEEDGSFQLKVMADTPFQIRTLDKDGNVVNGPCSWLWMRPNERRGCIGCHEDPEMVPDNIVSLAIRKSPVMIPVHITEVKEKIIELE